MAFSAGIWLRRNQLAPSLFPHVVCPNAVCAHKLAAHVHRPAVVLLPGTLSNMKVLMTANVETVIVLRSCAPLCVSFTDYCFHQRALPSRRSVFAMMAIFAGASVYVYFEQSQQQVLKHSDESQEAYAWLASWFALLIFQLTYGKQLVTGLGLQSIWSPVLYTNALALVPTAGMGYLSGDYDRCKLA